MANTARLAIIVVLVAVVKTYLPRIMEVEPWTQKMFTFIGGLALLGMYFCIQDGIRGWYLRKKEKTRKPA